MRETCTVVKQVSGISFVHSFLIDLVIIYKKNPTSDVLVTKKAWASVWLALLNISQSMPYRILSFWTVGLSILPEFGSVGFLTENDLPLRNSLQVSRMSFSWSCTEQYFEQYVIALIFSLSGSISGYKNRAAQLQAFSDICQRLNSFMEVCGSPGTDQGMRWYVPVQWSSVHFKHSYCQELDNVKRLVQFLVTSLTTIPFLVWRQIGAFPSFVYFTWEQMVHFPVSQLLWKVF